MQTYAFDIDGTICTNTDGEYEKAVPFKNRIEIINTLFEEGNIIKMFTARGSTTGIDWYEFTFKQLNSWNLKFHELILGKPYADYFIDDKGCTDSFFLWKKNSNLLPLSQKKASQFFNNASIAFSHLSRDSNLLKKIDLLGKKVRKTLANQGKIIFAGNGGSFADSQHLSAEFISKFNQDRVPLAAIALGSNSCSTTAIGNDYGYEMIFVREFEAIASKNDLLIAITTSGESKNIINLLNKAIDMKISSALLTGSNRNNSASELANLVINTPNVCQETASIQQIHIAIGHYICEIGQQDFIGK